MRADDRRLVLQARAGDEQAFRRLVQQYQGKAYAIAFGMLADPDDAMDVVQEAFIKVHRYLDRFKGSSGFYTWLYRIVVNVCIDHLRKVGKAQAVDYDDTKAQEGEPTDLVPTTMDMDPERSLTRREIREQVSLALQRLSPNHRAVILMREVEGLSYNEMAEAMQCSKGTIMSRLFHARRRMQAALVELMADAPEPAAPEGAAPEPAAPSASDGADEADEAQQQTPAGEEAAAPRAAKPHAAKRHRRQRQKSERGLETG